MRAPRWRRSRRSTFGARGVTTDSVIDNGFYLAVGFYGAQRFVWEFFKPYGALIGPFTLFHLLSAAIVAYAVVMIATAPTPKPTREGEQDDRAFA